MNLPSDWLIRIRGSDSRNSSTEKRSSDQIHHQKISENTAWRVACQAVFFRARSGNLDAPIRQSFLISFSSARLSVDYQSCIETAFWSPSRLLLLAIECSPVQ